MDFMMAVLVVVVVVGGGGLVDLCLKGRRQGSSIAMRNLKNSRAVRANMSAKVA